MTFTLPTDVVYILEKLISAGYEANCVGGCVRDMLMGITPHDYDIATNAPCEVTSDLFDKVIPTGIKHGTVTVVINDVPYEITRYRIDGEYADHRRPDNVEFTGDFLADLSRRDFTVNAIGYNPKNGLFDPFGGKEDIKKRIIRTVGDPNRRFDEDALRIIRGIRFSSVLNFRIEESTMKSIIKNSPSLKNVSAERIAIELLKTLGGKKPSLISQILNNGGFDSFGIKKCKNAELLDLIPPCPLLRLAVMCYLCDTEAKSICNGLKLSNNNKSAAQTYYEILKSEKPDLVFIKHHLEALGYEGCEKAIKACEIIYNKDFSKLLTDLKTAKNENHPYCQKMLAISGGDIMKLGFNGEEISRIQRILLEAVLKEPHLNETQNLIKIINNIN